MRNNNYFYMIALTAFTDYKWLNYISHCQTNWIKTCLADTRRLELIPYTCLYQGYAAFPLHPQDATLKSKLISGYFSSSTCARDQDKLSRRGSSAWWWGSVLIPCWHNMIWLLPWLQKSPERSAARFRRAASCRMLDESALH